MAEDISLDGKQYISSKRAAEHSDYSQDYIGQLARGGHIDAKRVGGMWYVSMDSLTSYKENTEAIRSAPEKQFSQVNHSSDVDSLISFDGKDYVSASRASKLTGYNPDYVGQLARGGKILSRQVGNRWYVDRDGILAHKQEKDSLLAAVQAESVGIYTTVSATENDRFSNTKIAAPESIFEYSSDDGDLLPQLPEKDSFVFEKVEAPIPEVSQVEIQQIPIRVVAGARDSNVAGRVIPSRNTSYKPRIPVQSVEVAPGKYKKPIFLGALAGIALTFVIVLSVGITSFKDNSMYASAAKADNTTIGQVTPLSVVVNVANQLGDILENLLVPNIHYVRK